MKIKGILSDLGLVEDDSPPQPTPPPQLVIPPLNANVGSISIIKADPAMVERLKKSILSASPIISQFMQNVEIARSSFPNDDSACMKAALAFTRVDKAALISELNGTISATLLHTKSSMETERKNALETATGPVKKELSQVEHDISEIKSQLAALQQQLLAREGKGRELQQKLSDIDADFNRQDGTVTASLDTVAEYIKKLGQTFGSL